MVDYIDAHKDAFGVEPICEELPIAPSTYYAAKTAPPSARAVRDERALTQIRRAHVENLGVYGARKVHAQLRREGHTRARCTVERLMRRDGLRGVTRARGPRTTIAGDAAELPQDLVERAFTATRPDQLWVADITYIRTFAGWVYAAFVTDVFSRRVVGWQLSTNLRTDLALDALEMGIWTREHDGHDTTGLTHHSDRGVNIERSATPNVSPKPAQSPRSAPAATVTTTPSPRHSTRSSKPSSSATAALGNRSRTSSSPSPNTSTGSTTDACTPRSE